MATDWAADVKKYAPNADDRVIAGIVRYCGIALTKVDSSLVAFSDKKETDRVRENFLKKKLGLTQTDKTLDAAIAKVGETMKADRTKNRVTVYYLLAENFKMLDLFAPKAKAAPPKKAPVVATTKKAQTKKVAIKGAEAGSAAVAGTFVTAGAATATSAGTASSGVSSTVSQLTGSDDEDSGLGWLLWLLFAALVAFVVWWVFMRGAPEEAAAPAATEAAAPVPLP